LLPGVFIVLLDIFCGEFSNVACCTSARPGFS
jgi:hypothetical protein